MLENLNRIFGACFPPLVILGWLGAGIFLYTAFRSGEWRKKLTGMEGFLALLLLFMMANRIPNPAIISFRYLIGIGVLTLFWSVWLLRWSWHNCPTPLRRWRGMLLLALIFGICLGGFLKEIRLSERTRRETEMIRFFRTASSRIVTDSKLILSSEERMSRILISAECSVFYANTVSMEPVLLTAIANRYQSKELWFFFSWKEIENYRKNNSMPTVISAGDWRMEYCGKGGMIYSLSCKMGTCALSSSKKQSTACISETFDELSEIPRKNYTLQALRRQGVEFAQESLWLPAAWEPNSGHGYRGNGLGSMQLKIIKNGIHGNSLFFSGRTSGSVMIRRKQKAGKQYIGHLIFRGTPGSKVAVFAYLYDNNDKFSRMVQLSEEQIQNKEQIQHMFWEVGCWGPEVSTFLITLEFSTGEIILDDFSMEVLE